MLEVFPKFEPAVLKLTSLKFNPRSYKRKFISKCNPEEKMFRSLELHGHISPIDYMDIDTKSLLAEVVKTLDERYWSCCHLYSKFIYLIIPFKTSLKLNYF